MSDSVGYLLDTNVISEPSKRSSNESVLAFVDRTPSKLLYVSVLTFGELRCGAKQKEPNGAELTRWIDAIERRFTQRTLPVTKRIAELWGELSAGRTRPVVDTLFAATALAHGMTRNTRDVADTGVQLLNPWT